MTRYGSLGSEVSVILNCTLPPLPPPPPLLIVCEQAALRGRPASGVDGRPAGDEVGVIANSAKVRPNEGVELEAIRKEPRYHATVHHLPTLAPQPRYNTSRRPPALLRRFPLRY